MSNQPAPFLGSYFLNAVTGGLAAPFTRVFWGIEYCWDGRVAVTYAGTPDDLIAAGCATAAMLGPYQRGKTPLDGDGDRLMREFRKGWLRLTRIKPIEGALRLPGITVQSVRKAKALRDARAPWLEDDKPDLGAYKRPRPCLRLVVDNTRRA